MVELPTSWTVVKLNDIGSWGSGGTPKRTNSSYYDGDIPWLVIGDLNDSIVYKAKNKITELGLNNSSAKLLKKNTLLIAMYGSIGKMGIAGIECATNQAIASCLVDENISDRMYMFYLLMGQRNQLLAAGKGGAQQNISQTVLKDYDIPLAPLKEQTRIANKLDSLLAKVEAAQTRLEKIPTILKRFRQSVLAAATSGELTKEWRDSKKGKVSALNLLELCRTERKLLWQSEQMKKFMIKGAAPKNEKWKEKFKNIIPIDDEVLFDIPNEWYWCSIDELSEIISDGDHNPPKKTNEGVRHLTIKNIKNGKISFDNCAFVSDEGYKKTKERYEATEGDVLISCIGTIGRTAIVGTDVYFSTDRNLAYVRLYKNINRKYIQILLDSPFLQNTMNEGSVGNAQFALYLKIIRKLPIPLCSKYEQQEIVRRVEALFTLADTVEKQYLEAKKRTDKLTQSILAKAFKGELVPQDPSDEPADKLLARIKALREQENKKQAKKKRATKKKASKQ